MKDLLKPEALFELNCYKHKQLFHQIVLVWDALNNIAPYLETQRLGIIKGVVSKEVHLVNPELINIGSGTVVEPGAYIKGPCIIGDNCTVRHGAYIRGNVITGDKCVIGHTTEVKNSIFLDHSQAAHFAYVGDSILGNHINLGAGVKLANLLFRGNSVKVKFKEELIDTARRKLGAIIADNSQVGCNSVTNPGTVLAKGAFVYPCINASGYIEREHHLKSKQQLNTTSLNKHALS